MERSKRKHRTTLGLGGSIPPSAVTLGQQAPDAAAAALERFRQAPVEVDSHESQGRYHTLCDRLPVGVYRTTPGGRVLEANAALVRMLGYPDRDSLLRANARELFVSRADRRRELQQLARAEVVHSWEVQLRRHDGTYVWAKDTCAAVRGTAGQVLCYEGILEEVTAQREAERSAQQSRECWERFMASTTDLCLLFDSGLDFVEANEPALQAMGLERQEVIGRNLLDISPDARESGRYAKYRRILETGAPLLVDDLVLHPKFGARHVILKAFRVGDGLGLVLTDVTELKRAQAELLQASRLASLGVLAEGIAHELRNPLGIILAWIQLLGDHPEDARLRHQCVQKVEAATMRASRVIEGLLRFAHPESAATAPMEISPVLDETLALLGDYLSLRGVRLRKKLYPNLPWVLGNQEALQQVFTTLVVNVCQRMARGRVLRVTARSAQPGWVEIEFRGTGPGIPADQLPRVFDPFFPARGAGTVDGLGLSVSNVIVRQHGGMLGVHSQMGKWTAFSIRLPESAPSGGQKVA